jgi:hypothetical protein
MQTFRLLQWVGSQQLLFRFWFDLSSDTITLLHIRESKDVKLNKYAAFQNGIMGMCFATRSEFAVIMKKSARRIFGAIVSATKKKYVIIIHYRSHMPVTRISNDYVKSEPTRSGTITRTRISGDYVRPDSCPARINASSGRTLGGYTTRARISDDYVRPSFWSRSFFHHPSPVVYAGSTHYAPPVVITNRSGKTSIAEAFVAVALIAALIAIVVLLPTCNTVEVCDGITHLGEKICHLERVCHSWW